MEGSCDIVLLRFRNLRSVHAVTVSYSEERYRVYGGVSGTRTMLDELIGVGEKLKDDLINKNHRVFG